MFCSMSIITVALSTSLEMSEDSICFVRSCTIVPAMEEKLLPNFVHDLEEMVCEQVSSLEFTEYEQT